MAHAFEEKYDTRVCGNGSSAQYSLRAKRPHDW